MDKKSKRRQRRRNKAAVALVQSSVSVPRQIKSGSYFDLYQQLNVGVDGGGVALTLQLTPNGISTSNLWGGNLTEFLPADAQFVQNMQNWQEYTVISLSLKFIPFDVTACNVTGLLATYIINQPIESVQDANNSIPTGSWYTQPAYKVTPAGRLHSSNMGVANSIAKYNAAPYIATGYPSNLSSARSKYLVPPSLSMRIQNPLFYATTSSIPALPRLGTLYYRMLVHFDGAIYNY